MPDAERGRVERRQGPGARRPCAAACAPGTCAPPQRPDAYVAISSAVAERIGRFYGREAEVVHPPVAVADFPAHAEREAGPLPVGPPARALQAAARGGGRLPRAARPAADHGRRRAARGAAAGEPAGQRGAARLAPARAARPPVSPAARASSTSARRTSASRWSRRSPRAPRSSRSTAAARATSCGPAATACSCPTRGTRPSYAPGCASSPTATGIPERSAESAERFSEERFRERLAGVLREPRRRLSAAARSALRRRPAVRLDVNPGRLLPTWSCSGALEAVPPEPRAQALVVHDARQRLRQVVRVERVRPARAIAEHLRERPTRAHTTGVPAASASRAGMPKPSYAVGYRKAVAPESTAAQAASSSGPAATRPGREGGSSVPTTTSGPASRTSCQASSASPRLRRGAPPSATTYGPSTPSGSRTGRGSRSGAKAGSAPWQARPARAPARPGSAPRCRLERAVRA